MTVARLGGMTVLIHTDGSLPPSGVLLGLDVESTYMDDRSQFSPDFRVRTVQFASESEAWVFDVQDPVQWSAAGKLLLNPDNAFCSHTPMDVLSVWQTFGIDISDRNIDTRMLAIEADPNRNDDRDLKSLATFYGMSELAEHDAELYQWMRDQWPGRKNSKRSEIEAHGWNLLATMPSTDWPGVFTRYAGLDAIACRRLVPLLIPATGNPAELLGLDMRLQAISNRITMRGMLVDSDRLTDLLGKAETEVSEAKRLGSEITGGVNIAGPKLVPWLETQGVDWSTWEPRTETGAPSLAKDHVHKLIPQYGETLTQEGAQAILQLERLKRYQDSYNKSRDVHKRLDPSGRIHPELNPVGASTTARMSSSRPNMQNFSKSNPLQRGMFIPEPFHVLATIDFAQIELRVVAALAREDKMVETIKGGGDLHQLTVDELSAAGVEITRQTAKIVNFLIVYGGGGKALHDQTGIPLDEAYRIVRTWRERYPSIGALTEYIGKRREDVRTISNRRLPVTRNGSGDLRTYANVNYLVQSSARELLAECWQIIDNEYPGIVWWPIHDELVLQIPEQMVDEVLRYAERAMRFDFMGVPITADAIVLRDEQGQSRWMSGDAAEKIEKARTN